MWKKLAYGAFGAIAIVLGAVQIYQAFVLPGCDESRVTDVVYSIFEENDTSLEVLDQIETTSEDDDAISCAAHVETAEETADITYTVSWDGWSAQVRIGDVEAAPKPADPAK